MTDTAIQERDELIAEALTTGRSVRAVKREFGLSTDEIDAVLERLWPTDLQSRLRMIKRDVGRLDKLTEVFYLKALAGDVPSGLLVVRIWERLHELCGLNAAAKIELVQAPAEQETGHERIKRAILAIARPGWKPTEGNGSSEPPEPTR